jgi:hypothetical protein
MFTPYDVEDNLVDSFIDLLSGITQAGVLGSATTALKPTEGLHGPPKLSCGADFRLHVQASLPVVFRSSFAEYKHVSSVEIKGD